MITPFVPLSAATPARDVRRQLARAGYVYLENAVDRSLCAAILKALATTLQRFDVLDETHPPEQLRVKAGRYFDSSHPTFREMLRAAYCVPLLHELPHVCRARSLAADVVGEEVIPLPSHLLRISFPGIGAAAAATPWHQDYSFFQGSERTLTLWCPFDDYTVDDGTLCVAAGRHREGEFPVGRSENNRLELLEEFSHHEHSGDVKAGDAILFTAFTPHCALPNVGRRIRVSMDFRYQPVGDPASDLIFGDFCPAVDATWQDIYERAPSFPSHLKHYWHNFDLQKQRHDDSHFYRQVDVAISALEEGNSFGELFLRCICENDDLRPDVRSRIRRALSVD